MEAIDFTGVKPKRKQQEQEPDVIDLTRGRRSEPESVRVLGLAERSRQALLYARQLEASGQRVNSRDLGRMMYNEDSRRSAQKAASTISSLKKRGLWPWRIDGTNGVVTSRRLIWPEPVPTATPVPPPPSPDRGFALSVLRQFLELTEDAQARSWPFVRGMVDAVIPAGPAGSSAGP
jgi:hypothetical protein